MNLFDLQTLLSKSTVSFIMIDPCKCIRVYCFSWMISSARRTYAYLLPIRQPLHANQTPIAFSQTMEVRAFGKMLVRAVERQI